MAKQKGILPIQGTIGNLTFVKTQDGFEVRAKGGVSAQRIATDPAFERTRENGAEFATAGKAGRILRNAFRSLLMNNTDARLVSRLTGEMFSVMKEDNTSPRGQRSITAGDITKLKGFEFNINGKLSQTVSAAFTTEVNRPLGELVITVAPFMPINKVVAPTGCTHFKLIAAGAEIDFDNMQFISDAKESIVLPWSNAMTNEITLTASVTPGSTLPLLLALGIEFYQQRAGSYYALKTGAFNCLSLVEVSKP